MSAMTNASRTFELTVDATDGICPTGERYAADRIRDRSIPVLSCEGPCIRGEIARRAANTIAKEKPFARACQGEVMTVPQSGMAHWVRDAEHVVVIDGCFLQCQARQMRNILRPGQLREIDALPMYMKHTDSFDIDDVPETERREIADAVAHQVLETLASIRA